MCLGAEQVEVILQALNRNRTIAENTQSRKSKINLRKFLWFSSPFIEFSRNTETIIHLLKGNIGIGVLTMPIAIRWYLSTSQDFCFPHPAVGFLGWSFRCHHPHHHLLLSSSWIIIITIDYFHLWWCLWLTNSFYSNAGLVGGVLGMVFVAVITIHCMHVLVRAAQKMVARYL